MTKKILRNVVHALNACTISVAAASILPADAAGAAEPEAPADAKAAQDDRVAVKATDAKQGPASVGTDAAPMQTVEVRALRKFDERREDAVTRIVITQADLVRFGDTTLADTLTHFPGITLTGNGTIAMRGLGNGYVQILLNGEKTAPGFTLDSLSPDLIERVEILRAGSADIGTSGIAGTVNVILKKTGKIDQLDFKAGLEMGPGIRAPNVSWQKSDKNGALSYFLGGSLTRKSTDASEFEHHTGTDALGVPNRLMDRDTQVEKQVDVFGFSPRFNYDRGGGSSISSETFLSVERQRRDARTTTVTSLGPEEPVALDIYSGSKTNTLLRTSVNVLEKVSPDSKLEAKAGLYQSKRDTRVDELGFTHNGQANLDQLITSSLVERGWTSTGKYSNTIYDGHVMALGWDAGNTRRYEDRIENAAAFTGIDAIHSNLQFNADVGRLAFYGQDEWSPTARLSLSLGIRWEGLYVKSAGDGFSTVHDRSGFFFPVIQANWKLPDSKNDQVRLAVTRTYNPPAIAQLIPRPYIVPNNSSVNPDLVGNPNLRAQLAMGLDAAYEHYWADDAMLSVSLYARNIQDYVVDTISLVGNRWVKTPTNNGDATTRGIEFDTKFPMKFASFSFPAFTANANLTRNWSSVDSVPGPDNRVAEQMPWSGAVGLSYRAADGVFSSGASFRYRSGAAIRIFTTEFSKFAPLRQFDVFGLWKLDPKASVRLTLVNLFRQDLVSVYGHVDRNGEVFVAEQKPSPMTVRVMFEKKL